MDGVAHLGADQGPVAEIVIAGDELVPQLALPGDDPVPLGAVDPVARVAVNSIQMQAVTPKRVIFGKL